MSDEVVELEAVVGMSHRAAARHIGKSERHIRRLRKKYGFTDGLRGAAVFSTPTHASVLPIDTSLLSCSVDMGCGDEHLLDDELFPHPGLSGQSMSVLDHTRAIQDFTAPEYPLDAAPLNAAGDRLYAGALGFNPHLTGAPSDTTYQHALTRWLGGVKPREIHVPFGLEVQCAVYALPDYDNVKSKLNSHRIFVCGVALVTEFNSDVLAPEEDMAVSFCGCCEQACNI